MKHKWPKRPPVMHLNWLLTEGKEIGILMPQVMKPKDWELLDKYLALAKESIASDESEILHPLERGYE